MAYLPTFCDTCFRAVLVAAEGFRNGTPNCSQCGATVRVVPGCSYPRKDVALFQELSETVSVGLSSLEARYFSEEVARALWGRTFARCIEMLVERWPSLVPLQIVTGQNLAAQERVLKLFSAIFDALARARASGVMSAVRLDPPAKRAGQN